MFASQYSIRFAKSTLYKISALLMDTILYPISLLGKKDIKNVKKILVIRKDEIGDMLISIPMYAALRKAYPKAKIMVLSGKPSAQVLQNNPNIDEVLEIETIRNSKWKFAKEYFRQISDLRKRNIDLAFDPKGSLLNVFLMWLAGIKHRVSYWNVSGGRHFLTHPLFYDKQMPEAEADINMIKQLGIKAKYTLPKLYFTAQEQKEAKQILLTLPKKFIGVYMTPSMPYKSWADEKWGSLFRKMSNEHFVIMCRDQEKAQLNKFQTNHENVELLSVANLRVLGQVLSNADAIVAVDGGPMHLSWISNPNIVALFGQNDILLWKPMRGKTITHLPDNLQGLNREKVDFYKPNKYMDMITVDEVEQSVREYL